MIIGPIDDSYVIMTQKIILYRKMFLLEKKKHINYSHRQCVNKRQ